MKGFLHIVSMNNFLSKIFKSQLGKERTFLVFLITALTIIWFRKGLILGSGESGLPFYNTSRLAEILTSSWGDVPLGGSGSIAFPSYLFYATIVFFQHLNIPSFLLQAATYWFIFVVGALSIHKIASLIKGNSPLSRFSSALFYIFNPIAHISILHRFQYPLIFFYAFMPLAFYIYFQGLKSKKFIYLVVLSLVSLIFSFTFVGPAFLQLFFGILGFYSFFVFISTFRKERDYFPLVYFLVFVVFFSLLHFWWLISLFSSVFVDLGSRGSVKFFIPSNNIATLKGISEQIESVLGVFRLFKPNDFFKDDTSWVWIYYTIPFISLSFFSIIAFIVGLFRREKELLYKFLILTALITMFWMKGILPPFGGITLRLFEWFTFLHVYRNPFEKIGLLFPFSMAIPVGFGIVAIVNILSNKLKFPKKLVAFFILTLAFPVFMFPTVTGLVFTGGGPPANDLNIGQHVKVPDYYKDAREWLDKQPGLFRVLVLPIDGEGMTYKWEYGFSGVELSNNLFNQPMISLNTSQGYLPVMIESIKYTLRNYPEKFWRIAQIMNIKYIIVRDDIDYVARETESPESDLKLITDYMNKHFSSVAEFGKLKIFELNSSEYTPRIYTTVVSTYIQDPLKHYLMLLPFSKSQKNNMFISYNLGINDITETSFKNLISSILINGSRVENITTDLISAIEKLPYVSIYRDTPFYALVRLKEELENKNQTPDTELGFRTNLLGKRLAEIKHSPQDKAAIDEYYEGVKYIMEHISAAEERDWAIINSLVSQREVFKNIIDNEKEADKNSINRITLFMDQWFIDIGARSLYPTKNMLIHRFNIPKDSQYEILLAKENWNYYFEQNEILEFDLDGKPVKLTPSQQGSDSDVFSFGTYFLNKGIHEVSIPEPKGLNLIGEKLPEELILSSKDKQPVTKIVPIPYLNNNYTYKLSFEYFEEKGNVPVVGVHSDADFIDKKGEKIPRFAIALIRDNYNFGWKEYSGYFTPFTSAKEYYISFKVLPFGDCKAVVERPYRRYCEDNSFNQRILRDSSYKIRNLKIVKAFENPIILREVETETNKAKVSPEIKFEQISPARYKVQITNAKSPFFLILSTSFDPRWKASFTNNQPKTFIDMITDSKSGDIIPSGSHLEVNGYANAWYIDKLGSYEVFLEYSQERVFTFGWKFSILSISILLLIIVIYLSRKFYLVKKVK